MSRSIRIIAIAGLLAACGERQPGSIATTPDAEPRQTKRERRASLYLRADANNDGVVTRAEIEREASERFAQLDGDGDGTVSRDEFAARSGSGRRRDPDRPRAPFTREKYVLRALSRFDRRDRDDDGRLAGEELTRLIRGVAQPR